MEKAENARNLQISAGSHEWQSRSVLAKKKRKFRGWSHGSTTKHQHTWLLQATRIYYSSYSSFLFCHQQTYNLYCKLLAGYIFFSFLFLHYFPHHFSHVWLWNIVCRADGVVSPSCSVHTTGTKLYPRQSCSVKKAAVLRLWKLRSVNPASES